MDDAKRKGLVASAIRNKSITLLLAAVLMLTGMLSLVLIPKEEFPHVNMPVGLVVGVYPGASPEEVEQQLTRPLENLLWTFKEIKKSKTTTTSRNGLCVAVVYLNDDVKNVTEFWNKLKERLTLFKVTLPPGVLALIANDDFGEVSDMLITLESRDKTFREMDDYVDALTDRLRAIPELANIYRLGDQKEQVGVYVDIDRLPSYGLNTLMLYSKLSGQQGTLLSGRLDDGSLSRSIHINSGLNSEQDIANTIISQNGDGSVLRLADIADVRREYPEESRYIKNNDCKCILLSLQMKDGNNVVKFSEDVAKIISDYQQTLPPEVKINTIANQGQVVSDSVNDFLTELVIAIVSVILVVMLMLPVRVAGVAVATIPITIFSSLVLFYAFGIHLNTVTLAALLVTLGMIVDDAVVVVDGYLDLLAEGRSRWEAAVQSARQFTMSILTATLVISITFFPLTLTTKAILHDFLLWFPPAVAIVLIVSLLVALLVVPILEYLFIKQDAGGVGGDLQSPKQQAGILAVMQHGYDRVILSCMNHKRLTMLTAVAVIALGGWLLRLVPQNLMPRATRDQLAVEIHLRPGSDIHSTARIADSLAHIMLRDERVVNLTTFYGSGSPRFHFTYVPQFGGSNYAQFIVNTHGDEETQAILDEYTERYVNYFPEAQVLFRQMEYTDAQYPVEVKLFGDNLDSLHVATDSIVNRLHQNPHILTVTTSWGAVENSLELTLLPREASRIGMSKQLLSLNMAIHYGGGLPVTSLWEGTHEVPVVLRASSNKGTDISAFKDTHVSGLIPSLTTTPLDRIAEVKPGWGDGAIMHINGLRAATVQATMGRHIRTDQLTRSVYQDLASLHMPEGVRMDAGGQAATEKTVRPQLYAGLGIAVVLIIFIILFHLRSIPMTLLILATLLFAIPGTTMGLLLFNYDFGATAILGIISLMGLICRCGIIMVDYAEELRLTGMTIEQAALTSARRRFRPIFLTSAAASMGVIPMVVKATPLWGPMGSVICIGAMVSTCFIVTVMPVAYCYIAKYKKNERFE